MLEKCKGGGGMLASARGGVKTPPYKSNRKRGSGKAAGWQTKRLHTQNGVQPETV